jgi:hypothetical protein
VARNAALQGGTYDARVVERLQTWCGGRARLAAVLAVCALGLSLRLDYGIRAPFTPVDDARAYARIARELSEHGRFAQAGRSASRLQPATNYSPGLPFVVAGVYEVRGEPDQKAARIVLALLGALAVPLAFALGRRFGGPNAGLVASVPMAIYPAILEYQGMLMTEPLGATLLTATTLCFLKACDSARPAAFAGSGLLLGATVMVRPEFLAFVVLLPTLAAIHLARRTSWRQVALPAGAIALAACLVVLPWTIRNLVVLDRFVPVSTGGGQALFEGSYIDAGPDPQNIQATILAQHPELRRQLLREHSPRPPSGSGPFYLDQVVAALAAQEHPGVRTDAALAQMGRHAYVENLIHRPVDVGEFLAKKAARVWVFGARRIMERPGWKLFHRALMTLALIGLIVGLVRRRFDFVVIATIVIVVTAIQAIFVASPRRTLLLLPLVCSLAGVGAIWLQSTVRTRLAARRAEPT